MIVHPTHAIPTADRGLIISLAVLIGAYRCRYARLVSVGCGHLKDDSSICLAFALRGNYSRRVPISIARNAAFIPSLLLLTGGKEEKTSDVSLLDAFGY